MASDPSILALRASRMGGTSWLTNRKSQGLGSISVGFTLQPSIVGSGKIGVAHTLNFGTAPGANLVGQLRRGDVILIASVTNGQTYTPGPADNLTNLVLDVVATIGLISTPASAFIAVTYSAPGLFIDPPTITPDIAVTGSQFTLTYGLAEAGGIYSIEYFRLNGQSKLSELVDLTWDSANEPAGTISYKVRYTNSGGFSLSDEITAQVTITANAPASTVPPAIAGIPNPGQTLTLVNYVFTGEGVLTYDAIWDRNGVIIPGQIGLSYLLTNADAPTSIRGAVRATDSLGRRSAYIYADAVVVDFAGLAFVNQPTTDLASYVVGGILTLNIGAAGPNAELAIATFALDGVDQRAFLVQVSEVNYTYNTTGKTPGAITIQIRASNSSESILSNMLIRPLAAAVSVVAPGQVADTGWSVVNQGDGGKLTFTVITPPTNGGTAITNYEVQQDAGAFISLGIAAPGPVTLPGFSLTVLSNYKIRAVNSVGPGILSVTNKAATAADTKAPETLTVIYDTATNAITATPSETAKLYYVIEANTTQHTGAALIALVGAGTTLSFGSMPIGVLEVTPSLAAAAGLYHLKIAFEDASLNKEGLCKVTPFDWPGSADAVAPVLSLPTSAKNGTSAFTGTVTTVNDANGTSRVVASTSITPPTGLQIEEGKMHTGAAAASTGTTVVSATGVINFSGGGLPAGFVGYLHYVHRDQAGNLSNVVTSAQFTTDAAAGQVDFVSSTLMISSTTLGATFNSTTSHMVVANANRVVVLMIRGSWDTIGPPTITALTFGGVNATVIQAPSGTVGNSWCAIAIAIAPAAGAQACSITLSANQRAISVRAIESKNVNQTTPNAASAILSSGVGTTVSFTHTTAANGNMLLSTANISSGGYQADITAISGATLIAAEQTGTTGASDHSAGAAYEAVPTAGLNGHGFNWIISDVAVLAWLELSKAA